jgi:hypothetical protein
MEVEKMTIKQIEKKIDELKAIRPWSNENLQLIRTLEIELSYRVHFK